VNVRVGSKVRLVTPDNPRLDGALATVVRLAEWGAHVLTAKAGSGRFRALFSEMDPLPNPTRSSPTGNPCEKCGSPNVIRTGSCVTCQDCGENSGCG
jgi:hypothetical protein